MKEKSVRFCSSRREEAHFSAECGVPNAKCDQSLSMNFQVGRVTPCAPQLATHSPNGAHGVTRPTNPRSSWPRCRGAVCDFLLTSATTRRTAEVTANRSRTQVGPAPSSSFLRFLRSLLCGFMVPRLLSRRPRFPPTTAHARGGRCRRKMWPLTYRHPEKRRRAGRILLRLAGREVVFAC